MCLFPDLQEASAALSSSTENHIFGLLSVLCPYRPSVPQPALTLWPVRSHVSPVPLLLLNGTQQHKPGRWSQWGFRVQQQNTMTQKQFGEESFYLTYSPTDWLLVSLDLSKELTFLLSKKAGEYFVFRSGRANKKRSLHSYLCLVMVILGRKRSMENTQKAQEKCIAKRWVRKIAGFLTLGQSLLLLTVI